MCNSKCHKEKEICANTKCILLKQDLKKNYHLASVHQNRKAAVQCLLMPLTVKIALCVQPHYQGTLRYSRGNLGKSFIKVGISGPSAGQRI